MSVSPPKIKSFFNKRNYSEDHIFYCKNCKGKGHFSKDCKKPINSYGIIALKIAPDDINDAEKWEALQNFYKNLSLFEYSRKSSPNLKKNLTEATNNSNEENSSESSKETEDLDRHFFEWNNGTNKYIPPQVKLIRMIEYFMPFEYKYLLVQRKHSIDYEVLIRGKYKQWKLPLHLSRITESEQRKILDNLNNFEELWDELWHNKKSKNYEYEKTRSKKKFEDLDFPTLFKQIPHKPFKKPSWGFPKGRRYNNETDRQCAIREFMEETGLKRCDFKMVALSQFFEKYVGSNDAKYSHKYYLAIVKPNPGEFENIAVDPNNSQQTSEIGDIGWFNFEDATNLIRDYYEEKKKVLKRVNQIFENIKNRHIQSD